jgi:hypothetical protein
MLLNTTTTSPVPETFTPAPDRPIATGAKTQKRPLDATLRSIFNPGPNQAHKNGYGYGTAGAHLVRRNKPFFGATFAQLLDLHLLCTRVPRTRGDAETAVALGAGSDDVKYAWVVEVLLDELGVWEWEKGEVEKGQERGNRREELRPPSRENREQRWCAVDVRDGVRVVNSFTVASASGSGSGSVNKRSVQLAAGFGGPRV